MPHAFCVKAKRFVWTTSPETQPACASRDSRDPDVWRPRVDLLDSLLPPPLAQYRSHTGSLSRHQTTVNPPSGTTSASRKPGGNLSAYRDIGCSPASSHITSPLFLTGQGTLILLGRRAGTFQTFPVGLSFWARF